MKRSWMKYGLAAMLVCFSTTAYAHFEKGMMNEETAEKRVERMKKTLGLTDDQATQIKGILDDVSAKMKALREEKHSRIDAVLTPEQREKQAKKMEKRKERKEKKENK